MVPNSFIFLSVFLLLNIFVESFFLKILWSIEILQEQHLFEI